MMTGAHTHGIHKARRGTTRRPPADPAVIRYRIGSAILLMIVVPALFIAAYLAGQLAIDGIVTREWWKVAPITVMALAIAISLWFDR